MPLCHICAHRGLIYPAGPFTGQYRIRGSGKIPVPSQVSRPTPGLVALYSGGSGVLVHGPGSASEGRFGHRRWAKRGSGCPIIKRTARGCPASLRVGSDHPNPRAGSPKGAPNRRHLGTCKFSDPPGPLRPHWPSRGVCVVEKKRGLGVGLGDPKRAGFPPESTRACGRGR